MLNLLQNYNPKDVMTEGCFPNARRIHRAVQRAPSYTDTRLLGKYSFFDHKKFSVYNQPFKLKSSLTIKYCQSTNFSLQRKEDIRRMERTLSMNYPVLRQNKGVLLYTFVKNHSLYYFSDEI